MSFADIDKTIQQAARTLDSLNAFEEWLEASAIVKPELAHVLERYRAARYVQTPAPTPR